MKADIQNGHLQIYPETEEESRDLEQFHLSGVNSRAGCLYQKVVNGVELPAKVLVMLQITRKGERDNA